MTGVGSSEPQRSGGAGSAGGGRQAGFDPEAEQEVDFGRYLRALGARWWLVVAGLVAGAIVGYAVSLGGSQTFKATATLYLGQPYSASGNVQLQNLQTNPSTVRTIIHSDSVLAQVASDCKARLADLRGGISSQAISGNIAKNGQTAEVSISVQSSRRRATTCAANALARVVVDKTSAFANQKIENFRAQVSLAEREIAAIDRALQRGGLSASDQLLLQLRLSTEEENRLSTSQLLLQATQVEKPSVLTGAHAGQVSARSRRNSVVVAGLIGLVLGAIAAIMWDGLGAGLRRRTAG